MKVNDDVVYMIYDIKSGKFYDAVHRILSEEKYLYNTFKDANIAIEICPQTIDDSNLKIIPYILTKRIGG